MLEVACQAAPIVELSVPGKTYQGLNVAHNAEFCWLAARDGTYERIDLAKVTSFRKAGAEFHGQTPASLAGGLRESLGRKYEVRTRGHFIICAPAGQAELFADLVVSVERSFNGYFSRRGWPLVDSPFPLVVIIYPDRVEFDKACVAVGMPPTSYLRGFYHPQTNRVSLYDQSAEIGIPKTAASKRDSRPALDDATRAVIIHETIHQLAFNSGLHQRVGENPRWVVEGLATMLEAGALDSTVRSDSNSRVNVERLQHFQEYRAKRRTGSIVDLVQQDEKLFQSAPLDFYSEAWAFSFYLSESRRPDYVKYLKRIASRDPLKSPYSPDERLADLQHAFGKDLRWLETQFLRFLDKLE